MLISARFFRFKNASIKHNYINICGGGSKLYNYHISISFSVQMITNTKNL